MSSRMTSTNNSARVCVPGAPRLHVALPLNALSNVARARSDQRISQRSSSTTGATSSDLKICASLRVSLKGPMNATTLAIIDCWASLDLARRDDWRDVWGIDEEEEERALLAERDVAEEGGGGEEGEQPTDAGDAGDAGEEADGDTTVSPSSAPPSPSPSPVSKPKPFPRLTGLHAVSLWPAALFAALFAALLAALFAALFAALW